MAWVKMISLIMTMGSSGRESVEIEQIPLGGCGNNA